MKQVYGNIFSILIENNTGADQTASADVWFDCVFAVCIKQNQVFSQQNPNHVIHSTASQGLHKTCIIIIFTMLEAKKILINNKPC